MNISPSQLGSDSDAQRMKAHVRIALFHANSFKEIEPSFLGTLGADICLRYSMIKESPEKRNQFVMEPGYVCFAALCSKRDEAILNVDVPQRVQVSFGKATALITSYLKANGKKSPRRLLLLSNFLSDVGEIIFIKRWFDFTGDALQPKLAAWIGASKTTKHRFFHNKPKDFQFEQGGIMASRVFTEALVRPLAPFDVPMTILASQSTRNEYAALSEEHLDGAPSDGITLGALRLVGVAFIKEFWNPDWPTFSSENAPTGPLAQSPFVSELPSAASIRADTMPQSSGLPPGVTGKSAELDPPVRRTLPFVDGCHLSPNVTV